MLHYRIQYFSPTLFHHCMIFWEFKYSWNQPHSLVTPVKEWMKFGVVDFKLESNIAIYCDLPAHTACCLEPIRYINNPKTKSSTWVLAIAWLLHSACSCIIYSKVDITLVSSTSIVVFRLSVTRFVLSGSRKFASLILVLYNILLMTLFNGSATSGIVVPRIGSKNKVSIPCPWCGVVWISNRWWRIEFTLCNGYHSGSSLIIPWYSF